MNEIQFGRISPILEDIWGYTMVWAAVSFRKHSQGKQLYFVGYCFSAWVRVSDAFCCSSAWKWPLTLASRREQKHAFCDAAKFDRNELDITSGGQPGNRRRTGRAGKQGKTACCLNILAIKKRTFTSCMSCLPSGREGLQLRAMRHSLHLQERAHQAHQTQQVRTTQLIKVFKSPRWFASAQSSTSFANLAALTYATNLMSHNMRRVRIHDAK